VRTIVRLKIKHFRGVKIPPMARRKVLTSLRFKGTLERRPGGVKKGWKAELRALNRSHECQKRLSGSVTVRGIQ